MIAVKEQKRIYEEIIRSYDFIDAIYDTIERSNEPDTNYQIELVEPVTNEMNLATEEVVDQYCTWIEEGQNASKADVMKMESSLRRAFASCTDFINKIKSLPETTANVAKQIVENAASTSERLRETILPMIGDGPGELIHGPLGVSFFEQIKRITQYRNLIQAVKNAMDHFFRITYCFLRLENGPVQNPNNVTWGRTVPDIQAQALLDKEKAKNRMEYDLSSNYDSHQDRLQRHIEGGQGRGD